MEKAASNPLEGSISKEERKAKKKKNEHSECQQDRAIVCDEECQYKASIKSQTQSQRGSSAVLCSINGHETDSIKKKKRNNHREEMEGNVIAKDDRIKTHDIQRKEIKISSILTDKKQQSHNWEEIYTVKDMGEEKLKRKRKREKTSSPGDIRTFEDMIPPNIIIKEKISDNEIESPVKKKKKKSHKSSKGDKGAFGDEIHLDFVKEERQIYSDFESNVKKKKSKKYKRNKENDIAIEYGIHHGTLEKVETNDGKDIGHVKKRKKHKHSKRGEKTFGDELHPDFLEKGNASTDEAINYGKKEKKKYKSSEGDELTFQDEIHPDSLEKGKASTNEAISHVKNKKKKKRKSREGDELTFGDRIYHHFIEKEKTSGNEAINHVKKEKKKKHSIRDGKTLEGELHLDFIKKEKISIEEVTDHIQKKKKKKKHKRSKENEMTLDDGIHCASIKKEKVVADGFVEHIEEKEKDVCRSSLDNDVASSIPGGYICDTRKGKSEISAIINEAESNVKHKKPHKDRRGREKDKIKQVGGKDIGKYSTEFAVENQENYNEIDNGVHEKEKKKKKKKNDEKAGTKSYIGESRRNGFFSLHNVEVKHVSIDVKNGKGNNGASSEPGKTSHQLLKKEIFTEEESMQITAKKIKKNKKRKHSDSVAAMSLEETGKDLGETTKRKRFDHDDMTMVGMQELENIDNIAKGKKKKQKEKKRNLHETRQTDSGDNGRVIVKKEVDGDMEHIGAKSKFSSLTSVHTVDSVKGQKEAQGHRKRRKSMKGPKQYEIEECGSTTPVVEDLYNELGSEVVSNFNDHSSAYATEQGLQTNNLQAAQNLKDNQISSKSKKGYLSEGCDGAKSYGADCSHDSIIEKGGKGSTDYLKVKCEVRVTPFEADNFHHYQSEKSIKTNGHKVGDHGKHIKKNNGDVANTTLFKDPTFVRNRRELKADNRNFEVQDYHLKWDISVKEREDLKRRGIEFEQGRWKVEEVQQLEDNVHSIAKQTGMTTNELVKLIKDKSSEGKSKKNDLGIYPLLLRGINRPIRLVFQKLKKLLDPNHFKGKWLKSEEETLLRLFDKHGHDWSTIGKLMGRSMDSIIHKLQRLLCGSLSKGATRVTEVGRWTEDEIKRLRAAIEKVTSHRETDGSNGEPKVDPRQISSKNIDWNSVSVAVKTRSAESCRFKWVVDLSMREPGTEKKFWTREQNLSFLETLSVCGKEHEKDVDWAQLLKDLELPGTVVRAKCKWKEYKFMVPCYERLSFSQQLQWLKCNFVKRMREKGKYTEVISAG